MNSLNSVLSLLPLISLHLGQVKLGIPTRDIAERLIYLSIEMIISEAFIMYLSYPFVIISYYLLMPIEIIIENYYVIKARKTR